jgi:hypothetical protein
MPRKKNIEEKKQPETPRAAKSKTVLDESEELQNQRALDEAAGVAPAVSVKTVERDYGNPPLTPRPANAIPLLKPDTREKLLYKLASSGTPLGTEFFDQFPDRQEILELALTISVRLMIVAICNSELVPTQRIAAMRCVMALNGKQLPAEDTETVKPAPPPPASLPSMDQAQRSIDRLRELSKDTAA